MPSAYVKKMADKHGISVKEAEDKWDEAKQAAEKQGQGDNYAYTTQIFKNMMGEKSTAAADDVDTVTMDVPLLTRVMELCREDIKADEDLHWVLTALIAASKDTDVLTMNDYDRINVLEKEDMTTESSASLTASLRQELSTVQETGSSMEAFRVLVSGISDLAFEELPGIGANTPAVKEFRNMILSRDVSIWPMKHVDKAWKAYGQALKTGNNSKLRVALADCIVAFSENINAYFGPTGNWVRVSLKKPINYPVLRRADISAGAVDDVLARIGPRMGLLV